MSEKVKQITPHDYRDRTYRRVVNSALLAQRVSVQETDIHLYTARPAADLAKEVIIVQRGHMENYIRCHPGFVQALDPWPRDSFAPPIVQEMIQAGQLAGVGPMAAVAGALAERVGRRILSEMPEVIVENGGDVFLQNRSAVTLAVFAGASPLSMKIGIHIAETDRPLAVCTSSGTVGHSLSFGKADAVCVLSSTCALADAAATAIGNRIRSAADIQTAIDWGRTLAGVDGILVVTGSKLGAWGRMNIIPL